MDSGKLRSTVELLRSQFSSDPLVAAVSASLPTSVQCPTFVQLKDRFVFTSYTFVAYFRYLQIRANTNNQFHKTFTIVKPYGLCPVMKINVVKVVFQVG